MMKQLVKGALVLAFVVTSGLAYTTVTADEEEPGRTYKCSTRMECPSDGTGCGASPCSRAVQPWAACALNATHKNCCLCPSGDEPMFE